MIPTGGQVTTGTTEETQQPSLTWKIDFENARIAGMTDGLTAIKQAVSIILMTERFKYLIHSDDFGSEVDKLIGKSPTYVQSEAKRMIREALTQDDRIKSVENMTSTVNGDAVLIEFTVVTDQGSFRASKEVNRGV